MNPLSLSRSECCCGAIGRAGLNVSCVSSKIKKIDWSGMAVRYIGSKARLAEAILDIIGDPSKGSSHFVDGFCGTGIVARAAALRGWSVTGNDTLLSATYLADASLYNEHELDFARIGDYAAAIAELNKAEAANGFIWRTYSPASSMFCNYERRYFTEDNARRIDGVRNLIADWHERGLIGYREQALLVADLIEATNDIANIAGTYGCFLKKWTSQSEGKLVLVPRTLFPRRIDHKMNVGDVFNTTTSESDTVYLDPPYTKRQYASYYHIPETIAYHDEPTVEGVAGLRPWKHIASPFCYKARALHAISDCIGRLRAKRVFLSYSSQGHVALDDLLTTLPNNGRVTVHQLGEIGRYRPNRIAAEGDASVEEYLIEVTKDGRA